MLLGYLIFPVWARPFTTSESSELIIRNPDLTTVKHKALGAALGLSLAVVASGASAYCRVYASDGNEYTMMPNTCLFMGSESDLNNHAADVCGSMPIVHEPSWNDQIVRVNLDGVGAMTIWANVVRDSNVFNWMANGADDWEIPVGHMLHRAASAVVCWQ